MKVVAKNILLLVSCFFITSSSHAISSQIVFLGSGAGFVASTTTWAILHSRKQALKRQEKVLQEYAKRNPAKKVSTLKPLRAVTNELTTINTYIIRTKLLALVCALLFYHTWMTQKTSHSSKIKRGDTGEEIDPRMAISCIQTFVTFHENEKQIKQGEAFWKSRAESEEEKYTSHVAHMKELLKKNETFLSQSIAAIQANSALLTAVYNQLETMQKTSKDTNYSETERAAHAELLTRLACGIGPTT